MNIIERDIWSCLKNSGKNIIIYGMGNGADKIINELERLNINIYGVMASDDFFCQGTEFQGIYGEKTFRA